MIFNLHSALVKERAPVFQFLVEVPFSASLDLENKKDQYVLDIAQFSWRTGDSGIIDWGDGTRSHLDVHEYRSAGIYRVSIIGDLYFLSLEKMKSVIRILTPIPKEIINSSTGWAVSSYGFLERCKNISTVPENLFDHVPNLKSIYEFFAWSGISEIPGGLLRKLDQLESCYHAFYGCRKLTSIPAGLFDHNPNITDLSGCFYDCLNLTGEAPELWKMFPYALHEDCFGNCKNLSNFDSIPSGWK